MNDNKTPQTIEEENEALLEEIHQKSDSSSPAASRTLWGDAFKRLRKNKLAVISVIWIIFVIIVALSADLWAKQWLGSPTAADSTTMAQNSTLPPSGEHPFGTDALGRDILVRVIYGARISLSVGVMATAISTILGLIMGALAGFYGGIWDTIIMRLADIFLAFPYVLFVVSLIAVLGRSLTNVFVAIGILGWPSIARVFRSAILTVKENDYVDAARSMGASDVRIIARHILPELRCFHRRVCHDEHRWRHPYRVFAVLLGYGRRSAHAFLGFDDSGRSGLSADRSLDDDHAWSRHSFDRARLHPVGRRSARCARRQDEGCIKS